MNMLKEVDLTLLSGGSRISHKGSQHRGGRHQLPTRLCFVKFVCQNKRIGSRGAPRSATPAANTIDFNFYFCHRQLKLWITNGGFRISRKGWGVNSRFRSVVLNVHVKTKESTPLRGDARWMRPLDLPVRLYQCRVTLVH